MKTIILVALALGLSACGGGSGGSSPSTPSTTELEGKWIYSSDVHPTGTACGLDSSGNYGQRSTVTFTGNQYTYTNENCLIISGNTGGYINSDAAMVRLLSGEFMFHRQILPLKCVH